MTACYHSTYCVINVSPQHAIPVKRRSRGTDLFSPNLSARSGLMINATPLASVEDEQNMNACTCTYEYRERWRNNTDRGKRGLEKNPPYLPICSNSEYENHAICTFVRKMHAFCRHQSLLSSDVAFSPSWLRRILSAAGCDALKTNINLRAFLRNVLPPYTTFTLLYFLILSFIYTLVSKVISFRYSSCMCISCPPHSPLPLHWRTHVSYIASSPPKLVNHHKL
jgi:hypothetical protein